MKRSRRRRFLLLALVGVPLSLVVILVLYLAFGDLGRHRGVVEELVSNVLGRQLKIAGKFEPRLLSLNPSVIAEDVSLANPDWSDEPAMAHVDRLEGSVNLASIFSGPIRIRDLRVDGAQVRLEVDGAGRASWDFDIAPSDKTRTEQEIKKPPIIFEQAYLQGVEFSFRNLSTGGGIELELDRASLDPAESGSYQVAIDGRVNDTPFELSGEYGPVEWFILFEQADYDLQGRLAEIDFALAGQMSNLRRLDSPDSTVEIHGADIAALTETFGLPSLGVGPFELAGSIASEDDEIDVALDAKLGEVDAAVRGQLASLLSIDELDLEVSGSGPSLGAFGSLFGAGHLPATPFSVSGRLKRHDGTTLFERVEAHLADDRMTVDGTVGKLPELVGTDVNVTAAGDDLSELSTVVGTRLPGGRYQVQGRLVRDEAGVELHDVRARLGETDLRADGKIAGPPRFEGSDLSMRASGPDLSVFTAFVGVELPEQPFSVEGTVVGGADRFEFDSVRATLGENHASLEGSAPSLTDLDGVDARLRVDGPDLAEILALAGLHDLPRDPYEVEGRVRVSGKRYELTEVTATVGDVTADLDGTIAATAGFVGTNVVVSASGRDLSHLGRFAAYEPLPADPFRIEGRVQVDQTTFRLEGVRAAVGTLSASADGVVGNGAGLEGSELEVEVRGERLSELAAFGDLPQLPAAPFSVAGSVAVEEGTYRLDGVIATLGANRIEVDGLLGPFPDLGRTELELSARGPDLGDVATMTENAAEIDLPDLPRQSFEVSGQVRVLEQRYELTGVETRVGDAKLTGHGWVGAAPDFHGTDVTLQASGPEASLIGAIAGLSLPDEPFRLDGRAQWSEAGARFHDVRAEVGAHSLRVDGTLGNLPKLVGTALDLHISGPEPQLLAQHVDLPRLPAEPYDLAVHFDGTPDRFTLRRLRATLGESVLAGEVSVDLREKPIIQGKFTSRRFDLVPLLPEDPENNIEEPEEAAPLNQEEPEAKVEKDTKTKPEQEAANRDKKRRVISDTPFDLQVLNDQDADVHLSIEALTTRRSTLTNFELRLNLVDGRLRVEPVSAVGEAGASFTASLDLEPIDEVHRVKIRLDLDDARMDLLSHGDDRQLWPPVDLHLDLSGEGRSPRELAASLNGYAVLDLDSGRMSTTMLDMLAFDVFAELLEILNPFRKNEPFTQLECALFVARFEDGRTTLEPIAMQTDKVTIVGHGQINLQNEKIDLDWAAKPRKGIGVSASAITNPYIKVGGTMGNPALEVKPLEGATAAGAAVATAGLSILARGMWDRITAERKVCKRAKKKLEEIKIEIEKGAGE